MISFAQTQEKYEYKRSGIYYGVGLGFMMPTGNLNAIGNGHSLGINAGLVEGKMMLGFAFDMFGNSLKSQRPTFNVWHHDSLYQENEYFGANIALKFSYGLISNERFDWNVTTALGYTNITYKSIEPGKDVDKGSLLFSPGISIQYFITKQSALWLQLEYHIANRKLKDNFSTDFSGNFFGIKLMYVGYIN